MVVTNYDVHKICLFRSSGKEVGIILFHSSVSRERKYKAEWRNSKMTSFTEMKMCCLLFDVRNLLLLSNQDISLISRFMETRK